ncbi:MAG: 16S rRNA (guanine(527)-N(7))-methyltransferase RsmG [Bacteroidetes bacterium]|jgi:16S rRNA (guanine527-N7)-methyltransferase|nr:16S rRNA (guanine(527)-N(7))-methyltransferase RsmG [Bacteroidota bacterium]
MGADADTTFDPFAALSNAQRKQLDAYAEHLRRFNPKINLISPDTEPHIRERHLLHSLALTWRGFPAGSRIVDWGTGGGLPAIPLAIAFPEIEVFAVDSVGKKVRAVRAMARRLGLDNLFAWNGRAENWTGSAHYSVSRATAPLAALWRWHCRIVAPNVPPSDEDVWPPGLICLKGGDLSDEIDDLRVQDPDVIIEQDPLKPLLRRDYFAAKCIVTVRRSGGAG